MIVPDLDRFSPIEAVARIPEEIPILILAGGRDILALPDEARATITFVAAGSTIVVEKWSRDRNDDFDALARFLTDVAKTFARNTSPIAVGRWNGGFQTS